MSSRAQFTWWAGANWSDIPRFSLPPGLTSNHNTETVRPVAFYTVSNKMDQSSHLFCVLLYASGVFVVIHCSLMGELSWDTAGQVLGEYQNDL